MRDWINKAAVNKSFRQVSDSVFFYSLFINMPSGFSRAWFIYPNHEGYAILMSLSDCVTVEGMLIIKKALYLETAKYFLI